MSHSRDIQKLIREYRKRGWEVRRTGGGHFRFLHPDGRRSVTTACSPGTVTAIKNVLADLKRCERLEAAG